MLRHCMQDILQLESRVLPSFGKQIVLQSLIKNVSYINVYS